MASISISEKTGNTRILFKDAKGKRRTLWLGQASKRFANEVWGHVEELLAALAHNRRAADATLRWVAECGEVMAKRLATAGLIPKPETNRLGEFLENYIKQRIDAKPATVLVWGHTQRCLNEYFGKDKDIRTITAGDGDLWRLWLKDKQKLSDNTILRRCGIAKQFFRAAARRKLIPENPFADFKGAVQANDERDYFVTRVEAQKVIDKCPDAEWRLIFALARYGGLRCPSEHVKLRWSEVDWDRGRFLVHSPKTEHHAGGEERWVPIFPELLPYLRESFELAEPGQDLVFPDRRPDQNFGRRLTKIIKRAGVEVWPKLYHNLRGTRETELAEVYPLHVVCEWIGNSEAIAKKHYLQVTDEHFAKAAATPTQPIDARATQIVTQQVSAGVGNSPQKELKTDPCDTLHAGAGDLMGGKGLEQPPNSPGKTGDSPKSYANRYARNSQALEDVTGAGRRLKAQGREPSITSAVERMRPMIDLTQKGG